MKEQLISFETANSAKEKGFNEITGNYYQDGIEGLLHEKSKIKNNEFDTCYEAPTQSLLQCWLREEHNIEVYIEPIFGVVPEDTTYNVRVMQHIIDAEGHDYEKALEIGLQGALLLIN